MTVPARIETPRLVLRRYRPADAPLLKDAIDQSLDRLQPWMPWARHEPTPLPELTERLRCFAASYDAGTEWVMGIFDREERRLLGGTGLHRRGPAHVLEIGYWLRTDAVGRGIVTETTAALVRTCFEELGAVRVELITDPRNERSGKVAERVGFRLEGTLRNGMLGTDRRPADRRVYGLTRDDWARERARIMALAGSGPSR